MSVLVREVLFFIIVFISNIIQAITGFAGTMLAMPSSMLLIGVNEAKTILNVLALLVCLWLTIKNYKNLNKKEFIKITVIMAFGMLAGIALFNILPIQLLLNMYAVLIIAIALKKLFIKKEFTIPKAMMILVILAAGIIHGMFVSGGSLLVIYAVSVLKDKSEFRATLSPVWVLLNIYLMFTHIQSGFFTTNVIWLTVICMLPLVGSLIIGNLVHEKINQETFLKLTYILLLISGILLIF